MRIESGYDLVALYLSKDDDIYPSKSPVPTGNATGCSGKPCKQYDQCEALEYTLKGLCRAPTTWQSDCPNAKPDARRAIAPQRTKAHHSSIPSGVSSTDTRQDRRRDRLYQWVRSRLLNYLSHPDKASAARIIYFDRDDIITHEDFDLLCESLWQEYQMLPRNRR